MSTPEQVADELAQEVRDNANGLLATYEATSGESFTAAERDVFAVGVEAGYSAALLVLKERGWLPSAADKRED